MRTDSCLSVQVVAHQVKNVAKQQECFEKKRDKIVKTEIKKQIKEDRRAEQELADERMARKIHLDNLSSTDADDLRFVLQHFFSHLLGIMCVAMQVHGWLSRSRDDQRQRTKKTQVSHEFCAFE